MIHFINNYYFLKIFQLDDKPDVEVLKNGYCYCVTPIQFIQTHFV